MPQGGGVHGMPSGDWKISPDAIRRADQRPRQVVDTALILALRTVLHDLDQRREVLGPGSPAGSASGQDAPPQLPPPSADGNRIEPLIDGGVYMPS